MDVARACLRERQAQTIALWDYSAAAGESSMRVQALGPGYQ
jgi:hypothetical protein